MGADELDNGLYALAARAAKKRFGESATGSFAQACGKLTSQVGNAAL
jgi:hypothetical protein